MSEAGKPESSAPLRWLVLVAVFPVDDAAGRMRLLRTLEGLGCAVMREGVFLLPDTPQNRAGFQRLADHIARAKGDAWMFPVTVESAQQAKQFRAMFDRSEIGRAHV